MREAGRESGDGLKKGLSVLGRQWAAAEGGGAEGGEGYAMMTEGSRAFAWAGTKLATGVGVGSKW